MRAPPRSPGLRRGLLSLLAIGALCAAALVAAQLALDAVMPLELLVWGLMAVLLALACLGWALSWLPFLRRPAWRTRGKRGQAERHAP